MEFQVIIVVLLLLVSLICLVFHFSFLQGAYFFSNNKTHKDKIIDDIVEQSINCTNVKESFNKICQSLVSIFDIDSCAIRFYDQSLNEFSSWKAYYFKNFELQNSIRKDFYNDQITAFLKHALIDKQEFLIAENLEQSDFPEFYKLTLAEMEVKTILIAPVIFKGEVISCLYLASMKEYKTWDEYSLSFLQEVIKQLTLPVNLFKLNNELESSLKNEHDLRRIIEKITTVHTLENGYVYFLKKLVDSFEADSCLFFEYDYQNNLVIKNSYQKENVITFEDDLVAKELFEDPRFNNPKSSFGYCSNINECYESKDAIKLFEKYNIKSYMYYSIFDNDVKGNPIFVGINFLSFAHYKNFSNKEINLFKLFNDTVALIVLDLKHKQENLDAKETFIATLTHDLKSPLIGVQKAIESTKNLDISKNTNIVREYLDDIYATNNDLLALAENMLSAYSYELGATELSYSSGNINEITEQVVKNLRHWAKDKNISVVVELDNSINQAMFDNLEIKRVIFNLVSNAIRHTENSTEVLIKTSLLDHCIKFSVKDNGTGISTETKSKIFQKFAIAKNKASSGLGLYLSKKIILAHNGDIGFESISGTGSEFYFTIPFIR